MLYPDRPSARSAAFRLPRAIRGFGTRHGETIDGYLFTAPFLIAYALMIGYPLLQGLYISTNDWNLLEGAQRFVGLDNYVRMFTEDPRFWSSTLHTLQFTVVSSPLIILVGLLQALALNRAGRSLGLLRTVFFSSYVLSISVITLFWVKILHPTEGILATLLGAIGIGPIQWLTDPALAMPSIVVATIWWTAGFNTVVFLAGLQDIPRSLHEAAAIDGAGRWSSFRHITLPMLRRPMVFAVIMQLILSFQIFGQVYLMTRGGPNGATRVLVQYIYESGFRDLRLGYASAMATFLFAVMLVVSLVQYRAATRKGHEP